jgi:alkanesulfonate monooxygenase SsuD/methylene tetrahydromethanopterin reductase-like flavin-dependent oxidoreductase (luciferase family)
VGISPWPEDFAALGLPWGAAVCVWTRRSTSCGLTGGGWFEYHGEVLDLERCKISPTPAAHPDPHRWALGSRCSAHGAATAGSTGGDPAELEQMLARVKKLRAEHGREGEPFEVHAISLDAFSVDGVRRLEDRGVTDAIVGFRWPYTTEPDTQPLAEKLDLLRRFADKVIAAT